MSYYNEEIFEEINLFENHDSKSNLYMKIKNL